MLDYADRPGNGRGPQACAADDARGRKGVYGGGMNEEALLAVQPLIMQRVREGHGSVLEVINSGFIQAAIQKYCQDRAQQRFDEYLAALAAMQKNSAD